MDGNQKPGAKTFTQVAGGIFLLAATAVIIWQMTGPSWFKNIRAEVTAQPYARTITVSGEGKVTAKPDMGIITLSVVAQGKSVSQVTEEGNRRMAEVVNVVKSLGVEDKDVVTSGYNLYPQYAYPENRAPVLTGYNLNQDLTVKIRKLEAVDDVLDQAINAGANQVGQLYFDIDEDSAVQKEARMEAFKEARAKAEEMASAAGVKVGRVVTFSEGGGVTPPIPYYAEFDRGMAKMEVSAAPSIEPGSKEITITVSVTYEIE